MTERRRMLRCPAVMGAVWKSEDNHIGVVLTNFLNEPFDYTYTVIPPHYGVIPGIDEEYRISFIRPEGTKLEGYHYAGPITRTERLGPREIRIVDIETVKQ